MAVIGTYYGVLKPERTLANVMTTVAGYLLASAWHIDVVRFMATIFGTTLIVASACAVNNATDRGLDARMPRTRKRALVVGTVPVQHVVWLAILLGVAGFALLLTYVNPITAAVGAVGYIDYVWLYAWSKRHTVHSTLIGTVSGAAPLVAGYTAVIGRFDTTALLLALIMVFWQMAHFFAIGVYRVRDYGMAGLPIFSVERGVVPTKRRIVLYASLFTIALAFLGLDGVVGAAFLVVMLPLAIRWLWEAFRADTTDNYQWGKQMFGSSLVVLLVLCGVLSVGSIIP